jgi:hypothetical protein
MAAVEANVRINGLWIGAANALDLPAQFLRATEGQWEDLAGY